MVFLTNFVLATMTPLLNFFLFRQTKRRIKEAINEYEEFIKGETLALSLVYKEGLSEQVDLNGHTAYIDVERA